uniref:DNA-directed DNA polymerase n=1 Tax=Takifugu rubripes TaxID=31033 RepID=A0A674PHG9_TAKRU
MKNTNLPSPTAETYHPHLIPFLSLKRKREVHENHKAQPPPKVCLTWPPPKWKPPHRVLKREVNNLADSIHGITTQSLANVGVVTGENKEKYNPKQLQQLQALPLKQAKEEAYVRGPHIQLKAHFLPTTLMFDPRVKDFEKLNTEEKMEIFEMARKASVLVLTLVYRDGSTQLDPEQVKRRHVSHRDLLLQVLSRPQLVVCYKAKDLLRTALQCYKQEISWKQVAGCRIQDPQVSGWLLDPANPCSSYEDLLQKYCKIPRTTAVSQAISGLCSLYWLNVELSSRLQSLGLWDLYTDMELSMIPVLAVMESYHIHVDKEAFQRTSDMLGKKLKQLEQEAHRAAGEIFLITSNSQLRAVLFGRLRLHERCENKKLPRTLNRQQSTSEAVLLQLQDLHPLPKIILEYRQVHKIKSTFVDGILSCVKNKDFISSKWHQTSAVTGRISSKHPNFQALPRQPLQITQKGSIQDFCQVELRLLAHFSSDPELLRIFSHPQSDVFTMLASQWSVTHIHVDSLMWLSVVLCASGRERLSGILGVSAEQASQFQDSFLQAYKDVQAFVQKTIQQCRQQGYVLSLMGRRRTLPNINVSDWAVRMQAERQAVNFVVQGSAADLCKTAMIRIFNLVSSSSRSARLVAQLHDELLYEVEDGEVQVFAGELTVKLYSVPLKVAVSIGKSWGSMSELNIPATSPSAI